jgi:hypothetical protein
MKTFLPVTIFIGLLSQTAFASTHSCYARGTITQVGAFQTHKVGVDIQNIDRGTVLAEIVCAADTPMCPANLKVTLMFTKYQVGGTGASGTRMEVSFLNTKPPHGSGYMATAVATASGMNLDFLNVHYNATNGEYAQVFCSRN